MWLSEQWNNPSRTDYYLMQSAMEGLRGGGNLRNPGSLKLDQFKIPFVTGKPPETRTYSEEPELDGDGNEILQPPGVLTKEQVEKFGTEMAKANLLFSAGYNPTTGKKRNDSEKIDPNSPPLGTTVDPKTNNRYRRR